jgi:hypothetical protein
MIPQCVHPKSYVPQTESEELSQGAMEVNFKLCTVNQSSQVICTEKLYVLDHMLSVWHTYNKRHHWNLILSRFQKEIRSFKQVKSHTMLQSFYRNINEISVLLKLLPCHWVCSVYLKCCWILLLFVSTNLWSVVTEYDRKLKFEWTWAKYVPNTFKSFESLNTSCNIALQQVLSMWGQFITEQNNSIFLHTTRFLNM